MQDAYGEDAEAVMKFKEEQGLIDDDENNPNGKVYLIAAREDETENYHRNSCLDACLMKKCMIQTKLLNVSNRFPHGQPECK